MYKDVRCLRGPVNRAKGELAVKIYYILVFLSCGKFSIVVLFTKKCNLLASYNSSFYE